MRRLSYLLLAANALTVCMLASSIAHARQGDEALSFNRDIRPILAQNCFTCHGQDAATREADLRLDEAGNAAVSASKPDASELWQRITSDDPDLVMPPAHSNKHLTPEQKETLRRWLAAGAPYDQHWAFAAVQKPEVPKQTGVRNPIDAFIRDRLQKEGLTPAPEASKETLIRRVTLDLTGLPPTHEEIDRFLNDKSDTAYEKLVEELQSRVTYGEHMSRYWLDVARYADTHGLHLDNERSMWPYRDWVVRAINENVPFDDFTRWQLAGDLLPEPTRDQQIASGFNRCNVTTGEGGSIKAEWIYRYAVERTSTTAEVWMGLTAGCAVCHDHKFDPLSTREYYSLYAFFHSAADPAMDGNKIDTPPILKLPTEENERRLEEIGELLKKMEDDVLGFIDAFEFTEPEGEESTNAAQSWIAWKKQPRADRDKTLSKDLQKRFKDREPKAWKPEEEDLAFNHWLRTVHPPTTGGVAEIESAKQELTKERDEIQKSIPLTFVMADLKKPRESFVMLRGAYDKPGERVTRNVPDFLPPLPKSEGEKGEETLPNRLDLANWLLDPGHPLTARVTVNRFWQQFFGTGLVETSEDFGTQGQAPSHPELLDWLAAQFVEDGWDMKWLVRQLVTSQTYRQSSKVTPELLRQDPANRLLARGPRLRLDAEVLRDQALFVSGLLVPHVGGPGVKPYQPPNIWEPVAFGGSNTRFYKQGKGDDLYRRSLYTFLKRTAPPPFMSTFDAPNREQSCSRRGRTNTPMQALQMMNDVQHVEAARNFAQRILLEGGESATEKIRWAWRSVTARYPDAQEESITMEALAQHRSRFAKDSAAARELVAYGESEPDPDIASEELASWTMLANLLLNLDECVNKN